jgi:hypothetical protein
LSINCIFFVDKLGLRTEAEIYYDRVSIRKFKLEKKGENKKIWFSEDRKALYELWKKQQSRESKYMMKKKAPQETTQAVEIRKPSFYDSLTGVA